MTLRIRLTLSILALVGLTLLLVWSFSTRRVLRPFAAEVFHAFADQAAFVGDRVDAGEDPEQLGAQLGLEVRRVPGPPPGRDLRHVDHDGRALAFVRGPRNHIFVETDGGWLIVRRELDLDRPRRKLALFVPGLGLVALIVASAVAAASVRPLHTARDAMERVAAGALDHRLPVGGPAEIARMARAFNAMTDRVEQLLRADRELMAGVSHELRTPLARMRLELELLREAGAPERRIAAMEGDLAEVDDLVGELLALSRLRLGDRRLETEHVDLRALAAQALEAHPVPGAAIDGAGAARGDRALLLRAVGNLLQNAARYAGGAPVRVIVGDGRITVEDGGPGAPPDALPRLFDPFFRAESSRSKRTGGLGLGLMIVRQVAELHGGTVRAENRPEGGLRVTLDLPAAQNAGFNRKGVGV